MAAFRQLLPNWWKELVATDCLPEDTCLRHNRQRAGCSHNIFCILISQMWQHIPRLQSDTECKIREETQQESGLKCSITEVYSTVSTVLWRQRGCYVIWNDQRFTI